MTQYPKLFLRPGKEAAVRRMHPWIFSGALQHVKKQIPEGEIVEIFSATGEYMATGHLQDDSIAVKLFSFKSVRIDVSFWIAKLEVALRVRKTLGLFESPLTNAFRLVNSEGDGLPGLIIDLYNGVAVIQVHSLGMLRALPGLVEALESVLGKELKAVYHKSRETLRASGGVTFEDEFLFGSPTVPEILEMGHRFNVEVEKGQKTGFFLDQRTNRMFAQFYTRGRRVLNTFCYSGAFSVYALKGGATSVDSVDSSRQAIDWTLDNVRLNGCEGGNHRAIMADVKKFLQETPEPYDMIILDPPAFAKHHSVTNNALRGYQYINAQAIRKLSPGGLLLTFSCSQAIGRDLFMGAVRSAAIESGRRIRVLHHLSQGPDHPFSIFHPEGEYLKGLVILVE